MNKRAVRAVFNDETIIVYQAFNKQIAESALTHQTFVSPPFSNTRMTWIKPSFLWMMYRSGWATKENQERILEIRITRSGFEWALMNSCLSHFDAAIYQSQQTWRDALQTSPVRIQWDPEKDISLHALNYSSIQIGLSRIAVEKYTSEWIVEIKDITDRCKLIKEYINNDNAALASDLLPNEEIYPLSQQISKIIHSF